MVSVEVHSEYTEKKNRNANITVSFGKMYKHIKVKMYHIYLIKFSNSYNVLSHTKSIIYTM